MAKPREKKLGELPVSEKTSRGIWNSRWPMEMKMLSSWSCEMSLGTAKRVGGYFSSADTPQDAVRRTIVELRIRE